MLKCAFKPERVCNGECAAYIPEENGIRYTYVWDTGLPTPEYTPRAFQKIMSPFCRRYEGFIGKARISEENGGD